MSRDLPRRFLLSAAILSGVLVGCDEEPQTPQAKRNVSTTHSGAAHRKSARKPRERLTKPVGALDGGDAEASDASGAPVGGALDGAQPKRPAPVAPAGPQATATSVVITKRDGARAKVDPLADVTTTRNRDGMRLRASVKVAGEALVLDLTVTNGTRKTVFVYAPLGSYDFTKQAWGPSAARVYSRFRRSGVLDLSKRLVPLPKNRLVYRPEVPYLTRLEAGAQLRETIRLPLPFKLDHPYTDKAGPKRAVSRGVAVSIGYAVDLEPSELRRAKNGLFTVTHAVAQRAQRILQGATQPIRVRVQR